jgi:phosphatidylserine/phosphatidylglycerophosphate/cardiolipin synthase-like enzyme
MRNTEFTKNILGFVILAIGLAFGIGYAVGTYKEIKLVAVQPVSSGETTPPSPANTNIIPALPPLQLCFSPQQDCESIIVGAIQKAQESIYIQAYSFTSHPIIHALNKAQERHVNVQIILDGKTKAPDYLLHSSLPIYIERMPGLAHNKVMIIDGKIVLTGSYNFTKAAKQRNAENLIKIKDSVIANQYMTNWQMHFKRAKIAA